ncbi:hypothetical protein [Neobacillus terrae]|uniref:hypothetical protein n=1 Tax=Neobacillus terrae TaxID=3034837 RepID=UPI0014088DA4|nr:hypothetical protein [Neobacillus terrae]NHM32327.1 hypothetical protein [Neobacillus terrae]
MIMVLGGLGTLFYTEGNAKKAEEYVKKANQETSSLYKEMEENLQFVQENGTLAKLNQEKIKKASNQYKKAVVALDKVPRGFEKNMTGSLEKAASKLDDIKDFQQAAIIGKRLDIQLYDVQRNENTDEIALLNTKLSYENHKFSYVQNQRIREVFEAVYGNQLKQLGNSLVADK